MAERTQKNLSDELLLTRFQSTGDKEYLSELFMRYMHLVYGVCMKYFADREHARDGVMQVFEKLVTTLPGQEVRNFGSWLYVLTKNHCLMQLRSEKAFQTRNKKWMAEQDEFVESEFLLHPLDSENHELEKKLADCIKKLNIDQQTCIRMFYYEEACYREIAEKTKIDEKKVKSHLQNGKRNLKLCLENTHV